MNVHTDFEQAVYLAGPINGCTDVQVLGWRARAAATLRRDLGVIDPAARDFRGVESENAESIVKGDLADIDRSRYLLAYCWQPSYGTAMEVFYAATRWQYTYNRKVVVVVPDVDRVSPWLEFHANAIFGTLAEAIDFINGDK